VHVAIAEQESLAESALNLVPWWGAELVPPVGSDPAELYKHGSSQKAQGEVL